MRHRLMHAGRRTGIALLLMLALLLAGCGSEAPGPGTQKPPSPEEAVMTDLPTSPEPAVLECGAPFKQATSGPLTMNGDFPTRVSATEHMVTGTVSVISAMSEARGVVTHQAEAFLVRDGRIVTLPMPQDSIGQRLDLTDDKVAQLPAAATLVPCAGGALAMGSYDLWVRVVLNYDDGSRADSLGGPWTFVLH